MSFLNHTKNQHYLSKIEQRFNATNPNARESNQRILEFDLIEREKYKIKLRSQKGSKIESNLSLLHLFSFDILEKEGFLNFETAFQRYESNIGILTKSLLSKIEKSGGTGGTRNDLIEELVNIFLMKLLTFSRNPYSVKKVINSFSPLLELVPASDEHRDLFARVLAGNRPHEAYLCNQLKINSKQYRDWLHILFFLLVPLDPKQPNMLEQIAIQLIESKDNALLVNINTYSEDCCLLSDRGHIDCIAGVEHLALGFNLTSKSFMTFAFGNVDVLVKGRVPERLLAEFKKRKKEATVNHCHDSIDDLIRYNRHVVYQCYQNVYCATTNVPGVDVI